MDNLLPVGSVVTRKGSPTPVMVMGYYPVNPDSGKCYTYLGIHYPIGYGISNDVVLFSKETIDAVLFEGYHEERSALFNTKLKQIADGYLEYKKTKEQTSERSESKWQT